MLFCFVAFLGFYIVFGLKFFAGFTEFYLVIFFLICVIFSFNIQSVSAKTFEPNISVICQRIFMKFKIQIF
jgi:hypothetical protein